jgi:hypothetical protein
MYQIENSPSKNTKIILDDKRIISYRPKLNTETGSVLATILLGQIMYWAEHFGNPFWKFMQPCEHHQYKQGDSWMEEIGFTRTEMETAFKRIGRRVNKKTKPDMDAFVWYWTDMNRLTWYMVNWDRVNRAVENVYGYEMQESRITKCRNPEIRNAGILKYVMQESGFTYKEQRLPDNTQRISSSAGQRVEVQSHADPADQHDLNSKGVRLDDDDLYRDLIGLGLPAELAEDVLFRNERCLVEQKLKDMVLALQKGKVENMTGYAMKVFNGVLYSDKQREKIVKRAKIIENGQLRIENDKRQDEERTIEMPEVSEAEKAKYLAELKGNKVLWGIYRQRGFESPMVRSHLKLWHADHADGADKSPQITQINTN